MKPITLKSLALALASAGIVLAAQAADPSKAATGHLTSADKTFVNKAAQGGMTEVELGRIAQDKAQSPEVKQFAARIVEDHTKANDELKRLASGKGVELPAALDGQQRADIQRLSSKSGADFDREYMAYMVTDHKKDVAEFQKELKGAKDVEVKSWAGKTLPTLKEHLALAQATNDKVKDNASSKAAPAKAAGQ